jgi:hypothetical protein
MTNPDEDVEEYGPKSEVWSHLSSGVELATMELDVLDTESRKAVEAFGRHFVRMRKSFALPTGDQTIVELFDLLFRDAWYRHAAEIELAWEGIDRASHALHRFQELQPVFTGFRLGEKAASYLREVVDTFLFGFDAACIALCGATLEQVLRELVVREGIYTERRLRADQPSGITLLKEIERAGLIQDSAVAERTLKARNRVMHQHMWEKKIIRSMALASIQDLGTIMVQLGNRQRPDAKG